MIGWKSCGQQMSRKLIGWKAMWTVKEQEADWVEGDTDREGAGSCLGGRLHGQWPEGSQWVLSFC